VRQIKNRRVAVVTGWALDPGAIHRNQCDAAFPLSDHADYNDLIRYVELVNPRRIRTLHGFAAAFAADLRARGWDAWALSEENQMELFHGTPASLPRASRMTPATEASRSETGCNRADQFSRFADTAAAVAVTSSNVRKVTLIAAYLTTLREHLESLEDVVTWFTGQPFPQRRGRSVQTGWAIIRRALVAAAGITESELRVISARHRDAGRTTLEVLAMRPSQPTSTIGTQVVREWFGRIAAARGPLAKTDLLAAVLRQCTSEEGSFLVRILTGDLRIGLKSGLLEDAVARAFATPLATIREAVMLAGDLGAVARKAAAGEPFDHDVQLFYPIHVMLASPEPTALAVWARMVENASEHHGPSHEIAWAEEKYDGIRAQFHARHGEARLFSRDLNDISAQFPELIHAAARQLLPEHSWILDGEIVADGPGHTFFDLQKRLGRLSAQADFLIGNEVPVRFQAFDLLACNGASQLKTALAQRRFRLESLTLPEGVIMAPKHTIADTAALERAFHTARAAGNEGLVVKLAASLYTPGRRGHAWIKLKQELTTLDVVVVAVEPGHGKRAHLLSDYTFALRCETSGKLRTVGKAYSGLTDDELEELTERFKTLVIEKQSRAFRVKPTVFLEVAFDSVQTSTRHDSGLALRFPRIKRLRDDKTLETIDTVAFARRLVGATTISGDRT
jgi:DNA ligase-1